MLDSRIAQHFKVLTSELTFLGNIHLIPIKIKVYSIYQGFRVCTVSQGVRLDRKRSEKTYFLV